MARNSGRISRAFAIGDGSFNKGAEGIRARDVAREPETVTAYHLRANTGVYAETQVHATRWLRGAARGRRTYERGSGTVSSYARDTRREIAVDLARARLVRK